MNIKRRPIEKLEENVTCFCCYMTRDELIEDGHDIMVNTSCCDKYMCKLCHETLVSNNKFNRCGYCRAPGECRFAKQRRQIDLLFRDRARVRGDLVALAVRIYRENERDQV
jgi:hypothetical protein